MLRDPYNLVFEALASAKKRGEGGRETKFLALPRRASSLTRRLLEDALGISFEASIASSGVASDVLDANLDLEQARAWFQEHDAILSTITPEQFGAWCTDLTMLEATPDHDTGASAPGEEHVLYDGSRRKQLGIYLTPPNLADAMAKRALEPLLERDAPLDDITVLDPACGAGALLLAAWRLIAQAYIERGLATFEDAAQVERAMAMHLRGIDRCEEMVAIARSSLRLEAWRGGRGPVLASKNHTPPRGPAPLATPSVLAAGDGLGRAKNSDAARAILSHQHACVIANPPYVLAQDKEDGQQLQAWARARFVSATYKVDTSLLFIERGLELLVKGGQMAILTPNSWLVNHHASPLRELLLAEHRLDAILTVDFNAFPNASVETIVTHITHDKPSDTHETLVADVREDGALVERARIEQRAWRAREDHRISLEMAEGDVSARELLEELTRAHVPLRRLARVYFGLQTRSRKQWVAGEPPEDGKDWRPCIDGRHIDTFATKAPTTWVCVEDEAIKSGGKATVHERERVGVRQIGATPIAALVEADVWTLNTIYNIYLREEALALGYDTRYILGVILSGPVQKHWSQHAADRKRIFPKIKKAALQALPIPPIDFEDAVSTSLHDEVVASVDALRALREQSWEDEALEELDERFERERSNLDDLVTRCFELAKQTNQ